jgi:hypothetical protein
MTEPKWPSGEGADVSNPFPSSAMVSETPSSVAVSEIRISFASACLRAFMLASRAIW